MDGILEEAGREQIKPNRLGCDGFGWSLGQQVLTVEASTFLYSSVFVSNFSSLDAI